MESLMLWTIVSCLACPFIIVGWVISAIALRRINRGEASGRGMARTGLNCSRIGCLIYVAVVLALVIGSIAKR